MKTPNESLLKDIKSNKNIITSIEEENASTHKCTKCGIIFSGSGEHCSRCRNSHSIDNSRKSKNDAESILATIASIALTIGIILSFILLFVGIGCLNGYKSLGVTLLLSIIPLLFSSIVTWGVLNVICSISNSLKELNQKIK